MKKKLYNKTMLYTNSIPPHGPGGPAIRITPLDDCEFNGVSAEHV